MTLPSEGAANRRSLSGAFAMSWQGALLPPLLALPTLLASCGSEQATESTPAGTKPPEKVQVVAIEMGKYQTCALTSDGSVYCWGENIGGVLGHPHSGIVPAKVDGLPSATRVVAGSDATCALTGAGALWCWGNAFGGKLGNAPGGYMPAEVSVGANASDFSISVVNSCKLEEGEIFCWGVSYGSGTTLPSPVSMISLSTAYPSCALSTSGDVYCWGDDTNGELGNGRAGPEDFPTAVIDPGEDITSVTSSGLSVFAVSTSGTVFGWGLNGPGGNLGLGDTENRLVPTALPDLPPMRQVHAGPLHACGVTADGRAFCWGEGSSGELGNGTTVAFSRTPVPVLFDKPVAYVAAGGYRTCLLTEDHEVYCFGDPFLGNNSYTSSSVAVRVLFPWEVDADTGAAGGN